MKLMIVDDHMGVRTMIRWMVAGPEAIVRECASGDEALRVAEEFRPDCVTLDIRMPGLCAFETARTLRARHPSARIFMVTTHDQEALRQLATAAGADGYFVKEDLSGLRRTLMAVQASNLAR